MGSPPHFWKPPALRPVIFSIRKFGPIPGVEILGPKPARAVEGIDGSDVPRIVSGAQFNPGDFNGIFVGASRPLKHNWGELTHGYNSWVVHHQVSIICCKPNWDDK